MNIIFGFGSTEESQRQVVKEWIFNKLKELYQNRKDKISECFNDDIFEEFKKDFKQYQKDIYTQYEKAEKSTPKPERYCHINYGVRMAYDYDTVFIVIKFWHINSRHPMSPDGIALMEYTETFTICSEQF